MVTRVSPAQASEACRRWYGIDGTAQRLPAEHDDTFRMLAADGTARLLKISVVDRVGPDPITFQTAILRHLAATAPELPVQRVVAARDGRLEVPWAPDGTLRLIRMASWLDGEMLVKAASSAALRTSLGATLGRLNVALRGFTHPGAARTHRWDLQQFPALRPLLAELPGDAVLPEVAADLAPGGPGAELLARGGLRTTLEDSLNRFGLIVAPQLATARTQVIHNDFHGHNLLSDGTEITGILDFGDALTGPVAMDVAVAACYQLGADAGTDPDADVLGPALDVVAGYHAADPLRETELPLIAELMTARIAARIMISQWNAIKDPANREYLLRRTPQAIDHLAALRQRPPAEMGERLRGACNRWDSFEL